MKLKRLSSAEGYPPVKSAMPMDPNVDEEIPTKYLSSLLRKDEMLTPLKNCNSGSCKIEAPSALTSDRKRWGGSLMFKFCRCMQWGSSWQIRETSSG